MNHLNRRTRYIVLLILAAVLFSVSGCNNKEKEMVLSKYDGPYSAVNGSYGGVDDLGRELLTDTEAGGVRQGKTVGIFYFLCLGTQGTNQVFDVREILKKDPTAYRSDEAWLSAGGGAAGTPHWWAEPLFDYYTQTDEWVIRKHIQMFSAAGIDYLMLDTSNGTPNTYLRQGRLLLELLDEYAKMGYTVPKIAYYTNAVSGKTMDEIYEQIYLKYPQYQYLWFQWDGKPLMVGKAEEASEAVKNTFRIKASQWPNEEKNDDGWPWIEFDRILTDEAVYGLNGRKEIVCVSPAQHSENWMSTSAFYGGENRSRSFYDGENHITEDSILYGYNFQEQWEWAIAQDPETIFITQWNEWHATRLDLEVQDQPIVLVDTATDEYSRDIEPMKGGFGDNYYMQMCYYIQKFKGSAPRVNVGGENTVDIDGSFSQWDAPEITALYQDFQNDTTDRNALGYGRQRYKNETGRNDIVNLKAAKDAENLYFYVDTREALTAPEGENWMTLFLRSGTQGQAQWNGYDYIVVLTAGENGGLQATLKKCSGGWSWTDVAEVSARAEGNRLMVSVPRSALGIGADDLLNIQFKWADNYEAGNVWSFYTDGDAAPYGRFNYVFSEQKWTEA